MTKHLAFTFQEKELTRRQLRILCELQDLRALYFELVAELVDLLRAPVLRVPEVW